MSRVELAGPGVPASVARPAGGVLGGGTRLALASPLAPLLVFLLASPIYVGTSLPEVMQLHDLSGHDPATPTLLGDILYRAAQAFQKAGMPILFLTYFGALPWVAAGAAGRYAEAASVPGGRHWPFFEQANRLWGRTIALLPVALVAIVAVTVVRHLLHDALAPVQDAHIADDYDARTAAIVRYAHHPMTLATTATGMLFASVPAAFLALCLSAIAVEDCGTFRSVRRAASFFREHPGTTARLCLIFLVIGNAPALLVQEAEVLARYAHAPIAFLTLRVVSAACTGAVQALCLASAVWAYAYWRGERQIFGDA